jgi:hypothetical protein
MPQLCPGKLRILVFLFSISLALTLGADTALAIPAFARKYKVSCVLCHAPFPRLNAFGETFAGNGFEFAVGENAVDTVDTGDASLRLQQLIPLAMRLDAYLSSIAESGDGLVASDLQTPYGIKLLSGGQVSDKVSYYLYFYMSERGEVAGLEDAYIQFTDIAGSGVSVIAGQFQVSDPLFKRELRLEYEDYQPYRVRVGDARADLAYERGLMASYSPWEGGDFVAQVVNGRGLEESGVDRLFDPDNRKNLAVRYSQDLGTLRVGGFVYSGEERSDGLGSDILIWGPDATIPLGANLEVNLQFLRRMDDNPFFLASCSPDDFRCDAGAEDPLETTVDAVLAEFLYFPRGQTGPWALTGLYNWIDADRQAIRLRLGEQDDARPYLHRYHTAAVGVSYLLRRNLRSLAEIQWDFEQERARFTAGVSAGF